MKRKLLTFMVGLFAMSHAHADQIVIDNVTVPQGGTVTLDVKYVFDAEDTNVGFKFNLLLPDGISTVKDEDGLPVYSKNDDVMGKFTIIPTENDGFGAIPTTTTATIKGTEGRLISITLCADASLEVGSKLTVTVCNASFSAKDGEGNLTTVSLENFTFDVTVGEPADTRIVIDEDALAAPEDAEGASVRVKRTISANTYSTLVLPFAMSGDQVAEVFGDDVELLDFAGYETTEDDDGNIAGITVNFNAIAVSAGIEANHPVVLKTTKDITEWTLDGVDIEVEEEPTVATVKRTKKQWSELIGSYTPITLEAQTLFLNSNKFWYSAGATTMKGLRAYFDFYDVLTEVEDALSIKIRIGDFTTDIKHLEGSAGQGSIYNLNGQKQYEVMKGLNIVDGNKLFIK